MIELEDVYDQINQTLLIEKENELFTEYVEELKDNAEIIIYN